MAVRAVVDQVPEHEGVLRERLVVDEPRGGRRQRELQRVGRSRTYAPEAGRLAVAEDRAPGESRHLANCHGLGEQHRGVRVVAGGEVDERDRHEHRVVVAHRFQCRDEVRATRRGSPRPRSCGRGCRSACTSGTRRGARARRPAPTQDGTQEASRGSRARRSRQIVPALQIENHGVQILSVVLEMRAQRLDGRNDVVDFGDGGRNSRLAMRSHIKRAVLGLQPAKRADRLLQCEPAWVLEQPDEEGVPAPATTAPEAAQVIALVHSVRWS